MKNTLLAIGGVVAVALVLAVGIASMPGTASMELRNKNLLAKASLGKSDEFVKCKATKAFSNDLFNVTMSYLPYNVSDTQRAQVLAVSDKFETSFNERCDPIIASYEDSFETYKSTSREIEKAETSALDRILGLEQELPDSDFAEYSPSLVFIRSGGATAEMSYSRDDVEAFFKQELGY